MAFFCFYQKICVFIIFVSFFLMRYRIPATGIGDKILPVELYANFEQVARCQIYSKLKAFLASFPVLYPLKRRGIIWGGGGFRVYKMGTLARNGLKMKTRDLLQSFRNIPLISIIFLVDLLDS